MSRRCANCSCVDLQGTLRTLNCVCGVALIIDGVLGFSFIPTRQNLFQLYIMFFGLLTLLAHLFRFNFVLNNFGFFKSHAGTGIFIIFCGLLCLDASWTFPIGIAICVGGVVEVAMSMCLKPELKPELNAPLLDEEAGSSSRG
mmetsp:Transcript_3596/g.4031  ORF Transcript_3596/g.4031 Transcript_3596/m.4031 type:complete len:143 (-) Transcript_3596:357-785(-)